MRVRTDYRSLSGMEKAAMFMLSLSEEHAAQLFDNMGDEEIRELSLSMANLGNISSEVVERLYFDEECQCLTPRRIHLYADAHNKTTTVECIVATLMNVQVNAHHPEDDAPQRQLPD